MSTKTKNIKSFVMFDTESTGLPSPGNNPRITELSFIAVSMEEIKTKQRDHRVFNKLHLCVNPCKQIHHRSSELTGLYNDALSLQATFSKQADLIVSFLRNLPQPTCLLAHNGHRFDFPLLQAELKRSQKCLSENVYCADSLEAFRAFDGLPPVPDYVINRQLQQVTKTKDVKNCNVTSSVLSTNLDGLERKRGSDCLTANNERLVKEVKLEPTALEQGKQAEFLNEVTPSKKTSPPLFCHRQYPIQNGPSMSGIEVENVRKRLFESPRLSLKSRSNSDECINDSNVHESSDKNSLDDSEATQEYAVDTDTSKSQETIINTSLSSDHYRSDSISDSDKDFLAVCEEVDGILQSPVPSNVNKREVVIKLQSICRSDSISDSDKDFLAVCEEVDGIFQSPVPSNVNKSEVVIKLQSINNNSVESSIKQSEVSNSCSNNSASKHKPSKIKEVDELNKNAFLVPTVSNDVPGMNSTPLKNPNEDSSLPTIVQKAEVNNSAVKHPSVNFNSSPMSSAPSQSPQLRKSYALGNLYQFYFGHQPLVAHTAEDDCKTLLKLISLNLDKFISYCDENAVLFSDVDPMY